MKLRREATLGVGALIGLVVVIAASSIGLLSRMSPAIGNILEENVTSEEAVEEMLAILAAQSPADDRRLLEARFTEALERARDNITEVDEPALIEAIDGHVGAALAGDVAARRQLSAALRQLGAVNRASMRSADSAAMQLGLTGAWAAALLGAIGFAFGVLIYRRIRLRLEVPIDEVRQTLERVRAEDLRARCRPLLDAPAEIAQIASAVNWLLDRLQLSLASLSPPSSSITTDTAGLRRALLTLMDRDPQPRVLLGDDGAVIARNAAALDDVPPQLLAKQVPEGWRLEAVSHTTLSWLIRDNAAPAD